MTFPNRTTTSKGVARERLFAKSRLGKVSHCRKAKVEQPTQPKRMQPRRGNEDPIRQFDRMARSLAEGESQQTRIVQIQQILDSLRSESWDFQQMEIEKFETAMWQGLTGQWGVFVDEHGSVWRGTTKNWHEFEFAKLARLI